MFDIISYKKSKKYTDKVAKGFAGGLKYQGSKPTAADLPTPSESIKGHMYTVLADGHEYVCDGSQWVDLGADLDRKADRVELEAETTARMTSDTALQNNINTKQDLISDLATIRDNATAGAAKVSCTDETVGSFGYTKNTGTYIKPATGIPKIDLAQNIQNSLDLADTALQSHQDISGKLDILPKVDDPSDPGFGWEYHIPYSFEATPDTEKLNIKLKTITLDNKLIKMNFDKSLPGATTTTAGLMTAADKIKLNAAITDISGKQDKLTAGTGIVIDASNKISADVRTYKEFLASWPHTSGTTIASFCSAVNESYKKGEIKIGDAFLGNVTSSAFFNGAFVENGGALNSAEVSVQIMTSFGEDCVQLLTTTSSNNPPYHWEYTYVDGAATEGWRCWSSHSYLKEKLDAKQNILTAGDNINIDNNTISANAKSVTLPSGQTSGTITDAEVALLNNSLTYIVYDNKHFHLSKVTSGTREILATYACPVEEGNSFISIGLIGKTWEYHAFAYQPAAAYIELSGTIADGAWHDGGTLSDAQVDILLASELNYIWMNGMHRLDFRYKDDYNNLATYSAQDGEKSHLIEITLTDKTWRYKHITEAPDEDGTYVFKCVVSNGIKTYQWVKE